MSISMIGIDYKKASVDVRAQFSFTKKNAAAALENLKKEPGILGCIILSTCKPYGDLGQYRGGLEGFSL